MKIWKDKKPKRAHAQVQKARKPTGPTIKIMDKSGTRIVPLNPDAQPVAVRKLPTLPDMNSVSHSINVPMSATQHVEMKTTAVDRAKGYLLSTAPLFGGFALSSVLVATYFWQVPIFSMPALVIFFLSFTGAWLISYGVNLAISPEGISLFESIMKWYVVIREQSNRWDYFNRRDR